MNWTINGAYAVREPDNVVLKKEFLNWVRSIGFEKFLEWGNDQWMFPLQQEADQHYEQVLADTGDKEHAARMADVCYMAEKLVYEAPWLYLQEDMLKFLLEQ